MKKSKPLPQTRKRSRHRLQQLVGRAGFDENILARTKTQWTVFHPDGVELGLLPVTFNSERMAKQSAALWNKKYRGHRVLAPNKNYDPRH
jgi:hypothetical protein